MNRTPSTRVVVVACAVGAVLISAAAWTNRTLHASMQETVVAPGLERRLISALDECMQGRFKDIDEGFGFRRIVKAGETPHRFTPENVRESDVVGDMESAGLRVVLYLAGRRLLDGAPDGSATTGIVPARAIRGPVLVTSTAAHGKGAPLPADLMQDGRRAMVALARDDAYDFTLKDWTFTVRPVRAEASCLHCHVQNGVVSLPAKPGSGESLRVGDPLGAVLYGYQQPQEDRSLHR